jgi:molybdate transport system substrate-binding protein
VQYAGSQTLAAQIEQGAEADVFASADDRWMRYLVGRGHAAGTPRAFARNGLVFIVPKSNPGRVGKISDAGRSGIKLVIGSDQVPVGAYTRLALAKLSGDPAYGEDFGRRVLRNVVSQEDNVKSIVNKVALGEADAGFVYRSDVAGGAARHVNTIELPASAQVVASYPIVALRSSRKEPAQRFIAFVLSAAGQSALRKEKFLPAS